MAHASVWSVAASLAQNGITFLLMIYLARVLTPRDFGLMSMIAVALDLGSQIVRWGQVELLQQARYRNPVALDQAFRISLMFGAAFALAFVLLAGPVGRAYHSRQITLMIEICAPIFLLAAVRGPADAVVRSEMRFKLLAFRAVGAASLSGVVAVVLVRAGQGPVALAAQGLAQALLVTVWVWSASRWRPTLQSIPFSRTLFREGADLTTGAILPMLVPRSVDLLVGLILGPAALGMMRIAFRAFDLATQMLLMPLLNVAYAQFGRLARAPEALGRAYLQFSQTAALLLAPLMIGFALVSPEAVPLLFGAQWGRSVPLVQIVGCLSLFAPVNLFFPALLISLGRTREVMIQAAIQLALGLALTLLAAPISLSAIVAANLVRSVLMFAYNVYVIRRLSGLRPMDILRRMSPVYAGAAAMAGAVGLARTLCHGASPAALLLILAAVGAVAYVGVIEAGTRLRLWPEGAPSLAGLLRGLAAGQAAA